MNRFLVAAAVLLLAYGPVGDVIAQPRSPSPPKPEGEMRWALYVTLAPQWFDPGDVLGQITPFWVLYAIHDALVKPMPGNLMTPSLAESWTVSADQRVYEFKLREGVKFHNGDPFTADDVKFSFHRYKGAKVFKEKVREVVVVDPHRVRFQLHEPFPDFMAFYGTLATGAGWVVPRKYIEKVGDDGFKRQPIGLGPYRFVSHTPGVELVMEAYEGYWRKVPSVKRLVFKSVTEATTRAAMLKRGEVDVAYLVEPPQALEPLRSPPDFSRGEAVMGYLGAVGIRLRTRPMERAAFFSAWATKKLKGVCVCGTGLYGNAATRISEIVPTEGTYAYGGYPDIDALYKQQGLETDRKKREAMLYQIQQLLHERVGFAPIFEYVLPSGIGPRGEEAGLMLSKPYPWSAPLEEVRLEKK